MYFYIFIFLHFYHTSTIYVRISNLSMRESDTNITFDSWFVENNAESHLSISSLSSSNCGVIIVIIISTSIHYLLGITSTPLEVKSLKLVVLYDSYELIEIETSWEKRLRYHVTLNLVLIEFWVGFTSLLSYFIFYRNNVSVGRHSTFGYGICNIKLHNLLYNPILIFRVWISHLISTLKTHKAPFILCIE